MKERRKEEETTLTKLRLSAILLTISYLERTLSSHLLPSPFDRQPALPQHLDYHRQIF